MLRRKKSSHPPNTASQGLGALSPLLLRSAHWPRFLPETTHTTVVARVFLQCRVLEGRVVIGDRGDGAPEGGRW